MNISHNYINIFQYLGFLNSNGSLLSFSRHSMAVYPKDKNIYISPGITKKSVKTIILPEIMLECLFIINIIKL